MRRKYVILVFGAACGAFFHTIAFMVVAVVVYFILSRLLYVAFPFGRSATLFSMRFPTFSLSLNILKYI